MPPAPLPSRREEFRELWKLALPIAIAQGGQSLMSFVDTAMVGRLGSGMTIGIVTWATPGGSATIAR